MISARCSRCSAPTARCRAAYLVTYPVLRDPEAVRALRREHAARPLHARAGAARRGDAAAARPVGPARQLRRRAAGRQSRRASWRRWRAPFARRSDVRADDLPRRALRHRAATPGGCSTRMGITVDVSIAPRVDLSAQGGPDRRGFDCTRPSGRCIRRCCSRAARAQRVVGLAARRGAFAGRLNGDRADAGRRSLVSLLSRLRLAERVTLLAGGERPCGHAPARARIAGPGWTAGVSAQLPQFLDRRSGAAPMCATRPSCTPLFDRLSGGAGFPRRRRCRLPAFIPLLDAAPERFHPPGGGGVACAGRRILAPASNFPPVDRRVGDGLRPSRRARRGRATDAGWRRARATSTGCR
jgi:hypothetical protein